MKHAGNEEQPHPLADLGLMREDWRFVRRHTEWETDREQLMAEYRTRWIQAATTEPLEHRKENAGRRAANLWLLDRRRK